MHGSCPVGLPEGGDCDGELCPFARPRQATDKAGSGWGKVAISSHSLVFGHTLEHPKIWRAGGSRNYAYCGDMAALTEEWLGAMWKPVKVDEQRKLKEVMVAVEG